MRNVCTVHGCGAKEGLGVRSLKDWGLSDEELSEEALHVVES